VLPKNADNYSVVLHVTRLPECPESVWLGYQDNSEDKGGPVQEIPEFPTVALPIAAIIGLASMLQLRKE